MRVAIVTSGSRGDVQPYVVLGLELAARGNSVVLATEQRGVTCAASLLASLGCEGALALATVAGDPTAMLFDRKCQEMLARGAILPVMRASAAHTATYADAALADIAAACEGAELIVASPLVLAATASVAEASHVPWVPVALGPVVATRAFPSWAVSSAPLPWPLRWLTRATYDMLFWALWQQERGRINAWRRRALGLGPMQGGVAALLGARPDVPVVMMATRHLVPGQAAPADWPPAARLTGFAVPPPTPQDRIDARLGQFLAGDGAKPLFLGFGSMPAPAPRALLDVAAQVVTITGRRAVLVAGWSLLDDLLIDDDATGNSGGCKGSPMLPPGLLVLKDTPYDALLPRCVLAVHHAGVGTCGAVLHAGIPSVPCPVMLDQPANAARLVEAGVACSPLPFAKLSVNALVKRILSVLNDKAMQERAEAVRREVLESYGGVREAADLILQAPNPWETTRVPAQDS